jgi:hypothetical protein
MIRVVSTDDLQRSRLTVFFRLILGLPHLLWLGVWSSGMVLVSPVMWIVTLIRRRPPDGLHDVYAMWIRYAVHVDAYLSLAANPYPGFLGEAGSYPVDAEIPRAADVPDQNRWTVFFRAFLALPPIMLAAGLGGGSYAGGYRYSFGALGTIAFLAWFAILVRGTMPAGLQRAARYCIGYAAQTTAYLFFVTPRYPNAHPRAVTEVEELPAHPVAMTLDDDPHRSRLTVFFRLPLAIPHLVWILLWGIVVAITMIVAWLITLIGGRLPGGLHRFYARYVRYSTHLTAFLYVAAGPFPGFTGEPGSYPIDVEFAGPERQNRWKTAFRVLLAIPAFFVSGALGGAAQFAAVGAWFVSLFTARVPLGLRALMAWSLRYQAQVNAYVLLLTDRYPFSAPGPCERVAEAPPQL